MKNVSSVLVDIKLPNGSLKATVSITVIDFNNRCGISYYANERGEYITINTSPRLALRLQINNVPWSPKQQIILNQRYIMDLKTSLKYFYKHLRTEDNFRYDDNDNLIEVVKDKTDVCIFRTPNQALFMEPEILTLDNGVNIPGILLTFNDPCNIAIISLDEFEVLMTEILNLNLYQSGMLTLNAFLSASNIPFESMAKELENRSIKPTNSLGNVNKESKDSVSGIIMPERPKSLFDLQ